MQLIEEKKTHRDRCRDDSSRPKVGARSLSVINNGHWQYPGTKSRKHLVREIQRISECNFESLCLRFGVLSNSWKESVPSRGLHVVSFKREFAKTGVPWTIGDVPDVKIHNGEKWWTTTARHRLRLTLRQKGLTVHRSDRAEEQRKGKRGK